MRQPDNPFPALNGRSGVTIIELLIACGIIAVLVGLIAPAIMQARESARSIQCRNNLKQLGIAVNCYLEQFQLLPQSYGQTDLQRSHESDVWSIHGHLLPYLDPAASSDMFRFEVGWTDEANQATGISQQHFAFFSCPSDPTGSVVRFAGSREGYVYPTNYGFSYGKWLVFDPLSNGGGDGCFMRNGRISAAQISDGLSNTICAAEIKSYQPCIVNTLDPGPIPPQSSATPAQYAAGSELVLGPLLASNEGHTEWCDGLVRQTGFTTTFSPNQFVPYLHTDGRTYDIDWSTRDEGTSSDQSTYAAITSRSHHAGLVNIVLMDGSVRGISRNISLESWRALGSRACGDVIGDF